MNDANQQRADHRSQIFISKKMSYALRHNPDKYGITLDEYGYTDLRGFIKALNRMHHFNPPITEATIRDVMAHSNKQRFAIENGKIAALYGHSVPGIIKHKPAIPPKVLYHGTARHFIPSIMKQGLLPMGRQYVHLSSDIPTAKQVGLRRDNHPVILQIDTTAARKAGVHFYIGNQDVWLAPTIPPQFLTKDNTAD